MYSLQINKKEDRRYNKLKIKSTKNDINQEKIISTRSNVNKKLGTFIKEQKRNENISSLFEDSLEIIQK